MYANISVLFSCTFCYSWLNATNDLFNIKYLHGDIDLSAYYSTWRPQLQRYKQDSNFIDSETLGEASLNIKNHLEYKGYSIFKIDYLIPLKNTPDMKRVIEFNDEKETSIEGWQFYFVLDPIMNEILPKNVNWFLRHLTKLKYSYKKRKFMTYAKNDDEFIYIPKEAVFNENTQNIEGYVHIAPNTNFVWNSEIINHEISLKMWQYNWGIKLGKKMRIVPSQIRIGYFYCTQKQPASGISTYGGVPSIIEVNFNTHGIAIHIVTINEEEQGLNFDWYVKIGRTFISSAAYDLIMDKYDIPLSTGSYTDTGVSSWYNLIFLSRFTLSLGLNVEVNTYAISKYAENEEDDPVTIWSIDEVPLDMYIKFGYRF